MEAHLEMLSDASVWPAGDNSQECGQVADVEEEILYHYDWMFSHASQPFFSDICF